MSSSSSCSTLKLTGIRAPLTSALSRRWRRLKMSPTCIRNLWAFDLIAFPPFTSSQIEAMEEFSPEKKWEFINSATQLDAACDSLSPAIYGPDAPSDIEGPNFSQMDSFVEFKFKASADPFIDRPRVEHVPALRKGTSFKQNSVEAKRIQGQLGSYVAAIAGSQFRLPVFVVLIFGRFTRLMCWDCSATVITEKFDYTEKPYLAQFLLSYCSLEPEQRGLNPTVRALTAKELQIVHTLDCLNDLADWNHHHREFCLMKILDHDNTTEHDFLISYPPKYSYCSPFGRATRPMRAYDMLKKKVVFVKDYWRPDSPEIEKEGDIYWSLERAQVPYITPFGVGNDVRNFRTYIQWYRKHVWACETVRFSGLVLYRMSLDKLGDNLVEFQSTHELAKVISHAMTSMQSNLHFDTIQLFIHSSQLTMSPSTKLRYCIAISVLEISSLTITGMASLLIGIYASVLHSISQIQLHLHLHPRRSADA